MDITWLLLFCVPWQLAIAQNQNEETNWLPDVENWVSRNLKPAQIDTENNVIFKDNDAALRAIESILGIRPSKISERSGSSNTNLIKIGPIGPIGIGPVAVGRPSGNENPGLPENQNPPNPSYGPPGAPPVSYPPISEGPPVYPEPSQYPPGWPEYPNAGPPYAPPVSYPPISEVPPVYPDQYLYPPPSPVTPNTWNSNAGPEGVSRVPFEDAPALPGLSPNPPVDLLKNPELAGVNISNIDPLNLAAIPTLSPLDLNPPNIDPIGRPAGIPGVNLDPLQSLSPIQLEELKRLNLTAIQLEELKRLNLSDFQIAELKRLNLSSLDLGDLKRLNLSSVDLGTFKRLNLSSLDLGAFKRLNLASLDLGMLKRLNLSALNLVDLKPIHIAPLPKIQITPISSNIFKGFSNLSPIKSPDQKAKSQADPGPSNIMRWARTPTETQNPKASERTIGFFVDIPFRIRRRRYRICDRRYDYYVDCDVD